MIIKRWVPLAIALVTTLSCSDAGTTRISEPAAPSGPVTWSLAKTPSNSGDLQVDSVVTLIAPLQVSVRANDTVASGVKVIWQVSMNAVDVGTLASLTDHAGIATLQFTLGPQAGVFVIVASLEPGSNVEPVTFNLTATPGHPAVLVAVSGDDQTALTGQALSADDVVRVTDRNGNGVPGVTIDWTIAAGGGSLSTSKTVTSADGSTSTRATLGSTPGTQTIVATANALASAPHASFSATGVASSP